MTTTTLTTIFSLKAIITLTTLPTAIITITAIIATMMMLNPKDKMRMLVKMKNISLN